MNKKVFAITGVLLFLFSGIFRLWTFHYLTVAGEKLRGFQAEEKYLTDRVTVLKEKTDDAGRLQRILAEAEKAGFIKSENSLSLGFQTEVAFGHQIQGSLSGF